MTIKRKNCRIIWREHKEWGSGTIKLIYKYVIQIVISNLHIKKITYDNSLKNRKRREQFHIESPMTG